MLLLQLKYVKITEAKYLIENHTKYKILWNPEYMTVYLKVYTDTVKLNFRSNYSFD